jgi:cell division protein FtsA
MSHSTKPIFALDIGTRSVVGLLLEKENNQYKVIAMEMEEHQERSMLDGQIHDVVAVAEVIRRVKERLEKNHGPLTRVAVAAAGRSLKTMRVKVDQTISGHPPINREEILALELSAVQEAQRALAMSEEERDSTQYYCVGYSVVNYFLDHSVIGNLIDQRGDTASVEIIATFLPRIVVDNIISALQRADLTMEALTLEPIAAIHVLIPSTMRRLNIALVDIGAGTSDIALTEGGTITAYGMVPIAGDEITDAIMQAFLLDFPVAEKLKKNLHEQEIVSFTDILGMEYQLTRTEVVQAIKEDIYKLAQAIGERIIELNGKPPQAVILIGGGSLTPNLSTALANYLGLPEARVAVRGVDAIQNLTFTDLQIKGPEFITPIGIAVTASEHPVKYLSLEINQKPLRLFDLRTITVGEALIAAGIDIKKLHGRPGLALTVTINHRMKMIPGTHGTPPIIKINGEEGFLDTIVKDGDQLEVIPGKDGEVAQVYVKDVLDEITTLDIYVNGKPASFAPTIRINGRPASWDTLLQERDEVDIHIPKTLEDIKKEIGIVEPLTKSLTYKVNGEPREIVLMRSELYLNGQPAHMRSTVQSGDRLEYRREEFPVPRIKDLFPEEEIRGMALRVTFNGQDVLIPTTTVLIKANGEPVSDETLLSEGDHITIEQQSLPTPIFSDLFRYIDFQVPTYKPGQKVYILKNGEPSSLDETIQEGDVLEIKTVVEV